MAKELAPLTGSKATTRYVGKDFIGSGTYGNVYRSEDVERGRYVALKEIELDNESEGMPGTALREISVLRELEHPNIIGLYDILHTDRRLTLVLEYAERDLKAYMQANGRLLRDQPFITKFVVWQMLHSLDFIHSRRCDSDTRTPQRAIAITTLVRVLHRDLKPQNILINSRETVIKLSDFGLARVFGIPVRSYTHEVVTLWYRAPEILLGSKVYSMPIDIWSVGCVMAELATGGTALFPGENEIGQLIKIFKVLGTPDEESWPGVSRLPDYMNAFPKFPAADLAEAVQHTLDSVGIDLLKRMLVYSPGHRISAKDALDHPYFRDLWHFTPGTRLPLDETIVN